MILTVHFIILIQFRLGDCDRGMSSGNKLPRPIHSDLGLEFPVRLGYFRTLLVPTFNNKLQKKFNQLIPPAKLIFSNNYRGPLGLNPNLGSDSV